MSRTKETAAELKMNMAEFKKLKRNANVTILLSLDTKYIDTEGEEGISKADIIVDKKSQDPLIEDQKRDLKNLITKGLSKACYSFAHYLLRCGINVSKNCFRRDRAGKHQEYVIFELDRHSKRGLK